MSTLKVGRRTIETSNEHKVLFPGDEVTKGELIAYYHQVASVMVPHLKGRPLTIQRFPDGIAKNGFYQKDASKYLPEWIRKVLRRVLLVEAVLLDSIGKALD